MNWKLTAILIFLGLFISCKSIKQAAEEVQYWVIELEKGVEKAHLIDNYSIFNMDNPRPSNRTLNQFITGFNITSEQEKELISLFEIDENIINFSKSETKSDAIQSSKNSAKAKVSPIKSSKQ